MDVVSNLEEIQRNIDIACVKSHRKSDEITVIGVTKYVTIERTKEAIDAGIHHLGENRTDEFLKKYQELEEHDVEWHFIGTLQSSKVKEVVNDVKAIHSLDRISLAKEIDKRADKEVNCFIQVNVSGEESKHGLDPENVIAFVEKIKPYKKVRIVGLMTMAPDVEDEK